MYHLDGFGKRCAGRVFAGQATGGLIDEHLQAEKVWTIKFFRKGDIGTKSIIESRPAANPVDLFASGGKIVDTGCNHFIVIFFCEGNKVIVVLAAFSAFAVIAKISAGSDDQVASKQQSSDTRRGVYNYRFENFFAKKRVPKICALLEQWIFVAVFCPG